MAEEFEEGVPIKLGKDPYIVRINNTPIGVEVIVDLKQDNGNKWITMGPKEIFDLLSDGIKFRKLKEAEQIKKEFN